MPATAKQRPSTNGQADVLGFGPSVELASGKFLITLKTPNFGKNGWDSYATGPMLFRFPKLPPGVLDGTH